MSEMSDAGASAGGGVGDERVVRWVCPDCGWSIDDDSSAGEGQPCEAWMLGDGETAHETVTVRVEYVRADLASAGGGVREDVGKRFKCPKGACDQVRPCAFYCWWRPTMAAVNHQAKQWGGR